MVYKKICLLLGVVNLSKEIIVGIGKATVLLKEKSEDSPMNKEKNS